MAYLDPINFETPDFGELYDELPLWSAPFGLWILDRTPMGAGFTFLDIGAGTGFLTIELAERSGSDSLVIAVDPWAAAMKRLQRKLEQRQLTNVRLLQQDAAKLDLPSASVDVIVSNLGLNNFDEPSSVLNACWHAAKPGAALLLTTNLVGHMSEFYDVYRWVLLNSGQESQIPRLDAHINHRATVDSVRSLLESAGFGVSDVNTDAFRLRFATGSALLRHYFIRLGFLQEWIAVAAPGKVQETFASLERELNTVAKEHGELSLTIPMALFVARKR